MKRYLLIALVLTALLACYVAADAETMETLRYEPQYIFAEDEEEAEISIFAASAGEAAAELDITMPDTIAIGEQLTVTINNAEDFTFSKPCFVDNSEGIVGWVDVNNGKAVFPEYYFDVGQMSVEITGFDKETGIEVRTKRTITVTGTPGAEGPTITSDKTSANLQENIQFTITMNGAERFATRFVDYENGHGRSYSNFYTYNIANEISRNESGNYSNSTLVCFAKAYINGAWTAATRYEVTINEAPKLDMPIVSAPSDVQVGTPFEITVQSVENAEYYEIIIEKNYNWVFSEQYSEAGTYTIPAISDLGEYTLRVYAGAQGYENSYNHYTYFNVVGEVIEGPVLTSDKEEYDVKEDQYAIFTAALEGAEQFKFQMIMYGPDGDRRNYGEQIYDASDGQAEYSQYIYADIESYRLELHARAFVNGVWTSESILSVQIKEALRLPTPTFTVSTSPHEAGIPVVVTINEVEGANLYFVEVYNNDRTKDYRYTFFEAGEHALVGLAEPDTYTIRIYAYPSNDYPEYIRSKDAMGSIRLVGALADGPNVTSDHASVSYQGSFLISASLEGAEKFYLEASILYNDGSIWSRNYMTWDIDAYDDRGEFNIQLYDNSNLIDKIYVAKVRAFVNGKWTAANEARILITDQETPGMLTPDFVLPNEIETIEESAFEGVHATAVYIHDACSSIGANAFANSTIRQIRLPRNCTISGSAFDGCDALTIITAPAGGSTETWAKTYWSSHPNCQFVAED